mgnify:CR=1 FL=1
MVKIIPIILSGGKGLRLWPLSRKQLPKQFIKIPFDEKYTLFQKTILDILYKKTKKAIEKHLELYPKNRTLVVAGGVAANKQIRINLKKLCQDEKFKIFFPDLKLCTDNAAMIALAGLERYKKKKFDKHNFEANPRWQLDNKAKFLKGAGVEI